MTTLNGADYRVKARHPRRDAPLIVTDKDGTLIAAAGDTCGALSPEVLASMVRNGFVERIDGGDTPAEAVPSPPRLVKRRATDKKEP